MSKCLPFAGGVFDWRAFIKKETLSKDEKSKERQFIDITGATVLARTKLPKT